MSKDDLLSGETNVDGEALRGVMRHVPSPVVVVTAAGEEEARGITIGSFTSVSLEPPLISFNVGRDTRMFGVITAARRFAVHLLGEEQAHLCNRFALPDLSGAAQFEDVPHQVDSEGTPVLKDVLAVLHCSRYAVYDAGDHVILLGEIVGIAQVREGAPILYYNRDYRSVGEAVRVSLLEPVNRVSSDTP